MTARLLATALALVMTGAPVAMTMCEAACAARAADAGHGGQNEHHSCHQAAPSNQVRIAGLPHGCGHAGDGDQLGADTAIKVFAPPVVLVDRTAFVLPTFDLSTHVREGAGTHSPPGPLHFATQLRI